MFRIAIVEDQEETRESLNRFVRQYAQEQGLQVEISLITDGAEIAEHYTPGRCRSYPGRGCGCGAGLCDQHGAVCHPRVRGGRTGLCAEAGELLSVLHKALPRHSAGTAAQRRAGGVAAGGRRHPAAGHYGYLLSETRSRMLYYHTAKGEFAVRASLQSAESSLQSTILSAATSAIWSNWPTSKALKATLPL